MRASPTTKQRDASIARQKQWTRFVARGERNKALIADYKRGEKMEVIRLTYKLSDRQVRTILDQNKVERRANGRPPITSGSKQ